MLLNSFFGCFNESSWKINSDNLFEVTGQIDWSSADSTAKIQSSTIEVIFLGFINAYFGTICRIIFDSKAIRSIVKIQIDIYKGLSLIRIWMRGFGLRWGFGKALWLIKNCSDFLLDFWVIGFSFPTKNFIIKDLISSTSDGFSTLNLFLEDFCVILAQNIFFEGANKRKEGFFKDIPRDEHCKEMIMLDFNKFFDQIGIFVYYAILKYH